MTTSTSIYGIKFELSAPYSEGHALTEAEANVLNQVRRENIANNMRGKIKDVIEQAGGELSDEQVTALQSKMTEYDGSYVIELRQPAAPRVTDPVEKEARKLAKQGLRGALAEKFSSKAITAALAGKTADAEAEGMPAAVVEKVSAKLEDLCTKGSKVWKAAEANVKKQNEATSGLLEDIMG